MHSDLENSYDRLVRDARMPPFDDLRDIAFLDGTIEVTYGLDRFGDRPFTVVRTTSPVLLSGSRIDFVWCVEGRFVLGGADLATIRSEPQVAVAGGLVAFGGVGNESIEYSTLSNAAGKTSKRIAALLATAFPTIGRHHQDDLHDLLVQAMADNVRRSVEQGASSQRASFDYRLENHFQQVFEQLASVAKALPMASRTHCLLMEDTAGRPIRLRYSGSKNDECSFEAPAGGFAGVVWPSLHSVVEKIDGTFELSDNVRGIWRVVPRLGTIRLASVSETAIRVIAPETRMGEAEERLRSYRLDPADVQEWTTIDLETSVEEPVG